MFHSRTLASTSSFCPIAASPLDHAKCSAFFSTVAASVASTATSFSQDPSPAQLPPFPVSSHEPLLLCNFDINPHTSAFPLTFLAATVLQVGSFYLLRSLLPRLSQDNPKSRRSLSWVLTFFSSMVLFTGTLTLSSKMEWGSKTTLLSLRNFPNESDVATMYSAFFVSYLICDLVLGMVYYRAYLDPLSAWTHHLGYLGVVSSAALQKNVSTLFAMGTPIELSTIILASGHVFPSLRSDLLFAVSFVLCRIMYPMVLLPELYLNVESRMYWKVGIVAFMVHLHWFRKFIQQQVGYYHARQQTKVVCSGSKHVEVSSVPLSESETKPTECLAESKPELPCASKPDHSIDLVTSAEKEKETIVNEHKGTFPKTILPSFEESTAQPAVNNSMSDINEAVMNSVQVNSSTRHKQCKVMRRRSRLSIDHFDDKLYEALATVDAATCTATTTAASAVATPTPKSTPAKTMKELLEECEDEDFSSYGLAMHSVIKGNHNKTFSPQALKDIVSSQKSTGAAAGQGAVSRASSMRDSKRRISLDAVRFDVPVLSSSNNSDSSAKAQRRASTVLPHVQEQCSVDEGATVVLRPRSSRLSVTRSSFSVENNKGSFGRNSTLKGDHDFGTIRMVRGVSIQA
ncbi:MAG: hypothetical protein J3Q66DRAFT_15417 [Benniella sp.]|nr:MAG: hypothetical protein J3Q66DRAFT_15417 [Benniella sp.]